MPRFLFVYHGGATPPQSEEEGRRVMQAWTTWMDEIGSDLIDPGNPIGKSSTVKPDGTVAGDGGSNPASGWSVVEAADVAAAQAISKRCPILQAGGSVELAPVIEM